MAFQSRDTRAFHERGERVSIWKMSLEWLKLRAKNCAARFFWYTPDFEPVHKALGARGAPRGKWYRRNKFSFCNIGNQQRRIGLKGESWGFAVKEKQISPDSRPRSWACGYSVDETARKANVRNNIDVFF